MASLTFTSEFIVPRGSIAELWGTSSSCTSAGVFCDRITRMTAMNDTENGGWPSFEQYERVISVIHTSFHGDALEKIEEYWKGNQ